MAQDNIGDSFFLLLIEHRKEHKLEILCIAAEPHGDKIQAIAIVIVAPRQGWINDSALTIA